MYKKPDFSEISTNLIEIFEDVKRVVQQKEGRSRGGLMLGLQEIGASLDGFIGAYYPVASNIIIVNKTPLRRILETNKTLLKPYVFHVLLHEYIHSLGYLDEETTEKKTYEISKKQFGEHHIVTELATNMKKYFPNLVYPIHGWLPIKDTPAIELVKGFDFSSSNSYIT
jgi:hypothetical protein